MNNPALYNAALAALSGTSQQAWISDSISSDYSTYINNIVTIATTIDAAIPTIIGDPSQGQVQLLQSIVTGVFAGRYPIPTEIVPADAIASLFVAGSLKLVAGQSQDGGNEVLFGPPSGGDDFILLQALADIEAQGLKRTIVFVPCLLPYICNTQFNIKPNTPDILIPNGVVIKSILPGVPSTPYPAIFAQPNDNYVVHSLHQDALGGSNVIVVSDTMSDLFVGAAIIVSGNAINFISAMSINSGNTTITLQRPLRNTALAGASVETTTAFGFKWTLTINGIISGTCSRVFSFPRCYECQVIGGNISSIYGVPCQIGSWDNDSAFSKFQNITNDTASALGLAIETAESCEIVNCPMPLTGINLDGTQACTVTNSYAKNGVAITAQQGIASENRVSNCGCLVALGAIGDVATIEDTYIDGEFYSVLPSVTIGKLTIEDFICNLFDPATLGPLYALTAIAAMPNVIMRNGRIVNTAPAASQGYVNTSAPRVVAGGSYPVNVILDNVTVQDVGAFTWTGAAALNVTLTNESSITLSNWSGAYKGGLYLDTSTNVRLTLVDSTISNSCANVNALVNSGSMVLTLVRSNFLSTTGCSNVGATSTFCIRRDATSTITGSFAPDAAHSPQNRGTVTNAGASVDVSFPDIKATDVPKVQQNSGAATAFTVSVTAGSKFTITGAAANYIYDIS